MKIVILARETDSHAASAKWGLEQAGYQVACWGGLGWTEGQQAAISLDTATGMVLGGQPVDPGDVVWLRRSWPATLHPQISEADKAFAEEEYRWFHYSLAYLLERLPVRCINRYSASRLINNKSVQLLLARKCGFHVPRTLMSNSPAALKSFLAPHGGRTICKAFFPHVWKKEGSDAMAVTEAFELSPETLPADQVLTYAPAIYQEMVVKQFDVRTVLMGPNIYSFVLHDPQGSLDWRQDACQGKIQVESIATPVEVEAALHSFARESGIVFGSFDFAVDMQGAWWFLEVNEQGQFLWLEEFFPGAKLLQRFLAFLTSSPDSIQGLEERASRFPALDDYLRAIPKHEVRKKERPSHQIVAIER
ncbi:MAG: hypothetical protein LAO20_09395 [Acidobacteriia bacterium]|nr:hypothetical protein [Terriglobia bacterium]